MLRKILGALLLLGGLWELRYIDQSTGLFGTIWSEVSSLLRSEVDNSAEPQWYKDKKRRVKRTRAVETLPHTRETRESSSDSPQQRGGATTSSGRVDIPRGAHIHGDITLLELPRLKEGPENYFVTHRLSSGQANYSVEYDVSRRHARWVAFTLDARSSIKGVKRTDAWQWDPIVPSAYSTEGWLSGTKYSRGHLVASADRLASREANEQTFYYTNISPQLQEHNGGIWQRLEQWLQNLGRNDRARDVVYIAKGGTIRDHEIMSQRIRGRMVIPKFYYMAIVVKKVDRYQGIAFWTEHRDYHHTVKLRSLAISIDELEERTGLDFFANFPNGLEDSFERMTIEDARWPGM